MAEKKTKKPAVKKTKEPKEKKQTLSDKVAKMSHADAVEAFCEALDTASDTLTKFADSGKVMSPKALKAVAGRVERIVQSVNRATHTSERKQLLQAKRDEKLLAGLNKSRAAKGLPALDKLPE